MRYNFILARKLVDQFSLESLPVGIFARSLPSAIFNNSFSCHHNHLEHLSVKSRSRIITPSAPHFLFEMLALHDTRTSVNFPNPQNVFPIVDGNHIINEITKISHFRLVVSCINAVILLQACPNPLRHFSLISLISSK